MQTLNPKPRIKKQVQLRNPKPDTRIQNYLSQYNISNTRAHLSTPNPENKTHILGPSSYHIIKQEWDSKPTDLIKNILITSNIRV